ncbi:MAG: BON domain-containing protein [Cytophagales bacterium]|nr:BON domain-containing protein [Cytophagales bacterium]
MKTDSQLQQDVMSELKWEPAVHAAHIGVEVTDGVVTLTGQVDSYGEKWHAERAAQRVTGVRALAVEIEVKLLGLFATHQDADIARTAADILAWSTTLPKDQIKAMVEGGWVTLSGEVDWEYQRQSAARSLRYLHGVRGISNQISIKPVVFASTVKSEIEAVLKRRAADDAQSIKVDIHGEDVTLTGHVYSWSERRLITDSAWHTKGVKNVVDKLTLML